MEFSDRSDTLCSPEALIHALPGLVYCARLDPVWIMDFVSDACYDVTGYASEQLSDNRSVSYESLIHPQDREVVRRHLRNALQTGHSYSVEYRLRNRDGQYRWVHDRGAPCSRSSTEQAHCIAGHVQDATIQKEAEAVYREAERRYRSIFDNASEGIFQSTPAGRLVTANPALAEMWGYDSPEMMMEHVNDGGAQVYVDPERRRTLVERLHKEGYVRGFESQVYRRDQSIIWVSENVRAVKDSDGRTVFFEGTIEDVTSRKLQEAVAQYQATHDSLTGLLNRDAFAQRLHHALAKRPSTASVAVLYVDVDQFKYVNDSLGHQFGDKYLRIIAGRLCSCVRQTDSVARQGGDEFVVLLDGVTSHEEAGQVAQKILTSVAQPWRVNGYDIRGTCSIGISIATSDTMEAGMMLRHADAAMFRAKALGRNNYRYFTDNLTDITVDRLEWMNRLRAALANGEFVLHYQPKIEVLSGRVVGIEALLRWRRSDGTLASPAEFIPLAEETGLIVPIGDWVLSEACRVSRAWQNAGYRPIPVAVNISPIQLERDDLVDTVTRVLSETGLTAHYLELEITESALMSDLAQSMRTLERMRELGVRSSIDDFGTGYSSLAHLKRFPVETLKIDRSFIHGITTDRDNAGIVQAIISLAHTLGLIVVAEGVETADEYRHLSARGCDQIQGYYTGRPMAADELVLRLGPARTRHS